MKVCVICGCDCSNRRNDVVQPTCDACSPVESEMESFGKLCSALFDLFMMGICVITIMFGIMSIVYMLLHWS